MNTNLQLKQTADKWELSGNTFVPNMDDTEMLFRIVTMTSQELSDMVSVMPWEQLSTICHKIQDHREEALKSNMVDERGYAKVTAYVVDKHITRKHWK